MYTLYSDAKLTGFRFFLSEPQKIDDHPATAIATSHGWLFNGIGWAISIYQMIFSFKRFTKKIRNGYFRNGCVIEYWVRQIWRKRLWKRSRPIVWTETEWEGKLCKRQAESGLRFTKSIVGVRVGLRVREWECWARGVGPEIWGFSRGR